MTTCTATAMADIWASVIWASAIVSIVLIICIFASRPNS